MDEILEKITRYNFTNYLLPGVVFILFVTKTTGFNLIKDTNIILILFLAYFIGMIISRLGSLIIEPLLKKIKFVKFVKYEKFLDASKIDSKLSVLSEENNTYRTYISLFSIILIIKLTLFIFEKYSIDVKNIDIYISIFLLFLFLFAYEKQTKYIKNRVNNKLKK